MPRPSLTDIPQIAVGRARAAASRARWSPGGRGAVLLYHRIASPSHDAWDLSVSPEVFARQIEMLARDCTPLPFAELVAAARARMLPARAVAVTFDDGYLDNLTAALPVLERFQVPATVFVTTGATGSDRPFWWDELAMTMTGPGDFPGHLELSATGTPLWLDTDSSVARVTSLAILQQTLRGGAADMIEPVMEELRAWRPADLDVADLGRPMSQGELSRLANSSLIEIGAHTRRHSGLASQDRPSLEGEVQGSRDDLQSWLGTPPASFAYPFGDRRPAALRMVRRSGFERAAAVEPDTPVDAFTSRFTVPRMQVEGGLDALRSRIDWLLDPN